MGKEHIQSQSITPDIDPNEENALYKVIDLAKELQRKAQELEERIEPLEEFVNE